MIGRLRELRTKQRLPGGKHFQIGCITMLHQQSSASVSYTHLDVYKRQALSRTESSLAARTGFTNIVITILLSGFCGEREVVALLLVTGNTFFSQYPDVYKRQILLKYKV